MKRHLNFYEIIKLIAIAAILCKSDSCFTQNPNGVNFKKIDTTLYIITYELEYKYDSLNLNNIRTNNMWLFLGQNKSYFVNKSFLQDMHAMSKHKSRADLELWATKKGPPRSKFRYQILKDYIDKDICFSEPSIGGNLMYHENMNAFEWELTQDTATVCGYSAQKATCEYGGRSWVAWFTSQIPINDGPYKFNGLPGLIVKIYDTQMHYCFKLKYLDRPKNEHIVILVYPYLKTTKEKFFKSRKLFRENIINYVQVAGANTRSQQEAARIMARKNNHIELKPN